MANEVEMATKTRIGCETTSLGTVNCQRENVDVDSILVTRR